MSKKFAMLIGNGFTTDFISKNGSKFNSSLPLKNFGNKEIKYNNFINKMPSIKNELINSNSTSDDFQQINAFIDRHKYDSFEFGHLRQFLALSYSELNLKIQKYPFKN